MKNAISVLLLSLIVASTVNAQVDHWWKSIPATKIEVKYFAPKKSATFGALQDGPLRSLASGYTKDFSDGALNVRLTCIRHGSEIEVHGTVVNTNNDDACFTLRVILPLPASPHARWGYDLDSTVEAGSGDAMLMNVVETSTVVPPAGAFNVDSTHNGGYGDRVGTGIMSFFPLASVATDSVGFGWGIDMGIPLVFRLGYVPSSGAVAEFDLATSRRTTKFPGRAFFTLHLFECNPDWNLRAALEKYYRIQPEAFAKRLPQEGIWLPFAPLWEIKGWQDFGFAFHETNFGSRDRGLTPPRAAFDADKIAGVLSFQYTEPWEEEIPIQNLGMTYAEAATKATTRDSNADYFRTSAARDKDGKLIARKLETPWFPTGWAMSVNTNPDPDLPGYNRYDEVRRREIDPALARDVDGIYFDCLEWHWQYDLNYNGDHFASTDYPLTFSSSLDAPRPVIWCYQSEYEFIKKIADEMHSQGKYVMGNTFYWIPFSAGLLDLFGSELSLYIPTDNKLDRLQFLRAMAYGKPGVFLQNEGMDDKVFTQPPYPGYKRYFDRMLLYGFYPSFFSVNATSNIYWADSVKYNQGREFFLKYIPLIKEIARAGWQPVTDARSSTPGIKIERFGVGNALYFTLFNPGANEVHTTIEISAKSLLVDKIVGIREMLSDTDLKFEFEGGKARVHLTMQSASAHLIKIVSK